MQINVQLRVRIQHLVLAALLATGLALTAQTPAASSDPLPAANPKYFQAKSPTVDTINAFLHALWGYDEARLYRVMAIMPTPAPGVSKIVVFLTSKAPGAQVQSTEFYTTPDGNFAIAEGSVIPFGTKPFAPMRQRMLQANGPARGSPKKDLLLVEFADLQCPHCKEAQGTMDQLAKDFPDARIVFQPFPLTEIHPQAARAAALGNCIAQKDQAAFFPYAQYVFDRQDALMGDGADKVFSDAITAAGQNPAAIQACASTPAAQQHVKDQVNFAMESGVTETPMLSINGHILAFGGIPYETLKKMILFQAKEDGVTLH